MLRTTIRVSARTAARSAQGAPSSSSSVTSSAVRRFASSKAADRPRTWRGAAARWGVAFGALYWYNTSPYFADELAPQTIPAPPQFSDADLPTVESVIDQKRKEAEAKALNAAPPPPPPAPPAQAQAVSASEGADDASGNGAAPPAAPGALEGLEEEAGQQAAFDPETGEINWDCPCLGGMAHGPCGEEFKTAFSCFVYSKEDPKGIDCIDRFQGMQECFRKYPEIYGSELGDEEEEGAGPMTGSEGKALPPSEKTGVSAEDAASGKTPADVTTMPAPAETGIAPASTSEPKSPAQADPISGDNKAA